MKVKRNSGYNTSVKDQPMKLVLDIYTLDIMCRYVLSSSALIRTGHLGNLRKFINALDRSVYENEPEKNKRIDFLFKALEARLDYKLTDKIMIITHINGGLNYQLDFIDYNAPELNKSELEWINQLISEALQYQFLYIKADKLQDALTRFKASSYLTRGGIVKEIENLVNELKNDFRHSRIEDNLNETTFSLRQGILEKVVTDVYNTVKNPSHRLITGMMGLNDLLGGGFESGRVYMLFGVGGVGKSLTLLNLLAQIKKYNKNYQTKDPTKIPCIVLLTMENTMLDTVTRLFAYADDGIGNMINYDSVDEVIDIIRNKGEFVLDSSSPIDIIIKYRPDKSEDTSYLYTLCEDLEDEGYEVIALIQDHVKKIRSVYRNQDIRLELGDIVNEMKVFAADRDIPVISVSHLNRDASRINEDAAAKGANIDVTLKMGVSNVGESILMIDNLDCGIIINLDFDQDGNRHLCYSLIKMRDKPIRTYIAQPFVYGSTIRLVEDVGGMPMFKESLHMAPAIQRNTSIKTSSANSVINLSNIMNNNMSMEDNAFANNAMFYNLNNIADDYDEDNEFVDTNSIDYRRKHPISPIYKIEQPDTSKLNELKQKIKNMRAPKDIAI